MAVEEEENQDDAITQKLNELYSEEDSSIDPELMKMHIRSLPKEDWQND